MVLTGRKPCRTPPSGLRSVRRTVRAVAGSGAGQQWWCAAAVAMVLGQRGRGEGRREEKRGKEREEGRKRKKERSKGGELMNRYQFEIRNAYGA